MSSFASLVTIVSFVQICQFDLTQIQHKNVLDSSTPNYSRNTSVLVKIVQGDKWNSESHLEKWNNESLTFNRYRNTGEMTHTKTSAKTPNGQNFTFYKVITASNTQGHSEMSTTEQNINKLDISATVTVRQNETEIFYYQKAALISSVSTTKPKSTTILIDEHCLSDGVCKQRHGNTEWVCFCHPECEKCNDCLVNLNRNTTPSKYDHSCYSWTNEYIVQPTKGFQVVDSCSNTYKDTSIEEKCMANDIGSHGTFVLHDKEVFKNKFCAYCNDVTIYESFAIRFFSANFDVENYLSISGNWSEAAKLKFFLVSAFFQVVAPENNMLKTCIIKPADDDDYICQLFSNNTRSLDTDLPHTYTFCARKNEFERAMCIGVGDIYMIRTDVIYGLSVMFNFRPKITQEDNDISYQCHTWTKEVSQLLTSFSITCIMICLGQD